MFSRAVRRPASCRAARPAGALVEGVVPVDGLAQVVADVAGVGGRGAGAAGPSWPRVGVGEGAPAATRSPTATVTARMTHGRVRHDDVVHLHGLEHDHLGAGGDLLPRLAVATTTPGIGARTRAASAGAAGGGPPWLLTRLGRRRSGRPPAPGRHRTGAAALAGQQAGVRVEVAGVDPALAQRGRR